MLFLFKGLLLINEPEVFLPKYSQKAILHAAHFWRVVNTCTQHGGNRPEHVGTDLSIFNSKGKKSIITAGAPVRNQMVPRVQLQIHNYEGI